MNWFEDWFDTPYYHVLYKNRDDAEAEKFMTNILAALELPKTAIILDLACGKGRHSVYINQLGYTVMGVDLAVNSIQKAKKKETETLTFQVHDMRQLLVHEPFDAAFNLFTSLGYFENPADNLAVFKSVYSQLKEKGIFVIDFFNAQKVIEKIIPSETKTIDAIDFKITKTIKNGFVQKDICFFADGKDWQFQEKVQLMSLECFYDLAKQSGFTITNIFGDYNLTPFDLINSDRLILILEK